jgi:DNA-3-methyladenine glycosylase II
MTGALTAETPAARRRAFAALGQADPVLAGLAESCGLPDPFFFPDGGRTTGSNFAAMTLHILGQQISTKVAFVLYDRLAAATGGTPTPDAVLRLSAGRLRELGTSRSKAEYLRSLAEHVATGELDIENMRELTDQQAVGALTHVKGVGVWTAEMFLIHQLHRADILPAGDLGIRKAVRNVYHLGETPTVDQVRQRGLAWAPYRTYATALLWRSLGG